MRWALRCEWMAGRNTTSSQAMNIDAWNNSDARWVAPLFAAAFTDDPGFRWMFPDSSRRSEQILWVQHFLIRAKKGITRREHIERKATAQWAAPGTSPNVSFATELCAGILGAPASLGLAATIRGLRADHYVKLRLKRIEREAWYLDTLAVHPSEQGKGLGGALIRRGLQRAGASPVYLYTAKPSNVAFYRRFGFEITDESLLVPDGPPAWTMRRHQRVTA